MNRGLIGKTIEQYKIHRLIGHGGMASVYQATDTRLQREVAIKILHPHLAAQDVFQQRFLQEARAVAMLDHPNIVKVLAFDNKDGELYMVMELITGGNLRSYMRSLERENRQIDFMEALEHARQMADALNYAYQQGMIHRDIKPDNIMLKPTDNASTLSSYQAVLTDFGIAKLMESQAAYDTDQPAGTFAYMSPEQCRGERMDGRADIYELGVVLYEVLVGKLPYNPKSIAEAIRMHQRDPLVKPSTAKPGFPPYIDRIILRALEKDPNDRYQTAGELSRALQEAQRIHLQGAVATLDAPKTDPDGTSTQVMPVPIDPHIPNPAPPEIPADQTMHDQVFIFAENYPTRTVSITKVITTIGRDEDRDIKLDSRTVSRRHARLERTLDNEYLLIDMGTTNGTYLGDVGLIANVPELVEFGKIIRIGEYWLKIEPAPNPQGYASATQLEAPSPRLRSMRPSRRDRNRPLTPITSNTDNKGDGQTVAEAAAAPRIGRGASRTTAPRAAPSQVVVERELIRLNLTQPRLAVQPGSRVTLPIEVVNESAVVDHFSVQVFGLPPDWVTIPYVPMYLLPGARDTAAVEFHPPTGPTSTAGQHAFEVRVVSRAQNMQSAAVQGALDVLPVRHYSAELNPTRIKRKGTTELVLTNSGNIPTTFVVTTRDREQAIVHQTSGKQFVLPPGYTEYITIKLQPRERQLIGGQSLAPFDVTVVPREEAGGSRTFNGELLYYAIFPSWIVPIMMLLCVFLTGLALLAGAQINNILNTNATATQVQATNFILATATAYATSDPDEDGLYNAQELELLTAPDLADTDEDGLSDSEELDIYQTDPTNRDTDGDNLTDGVEVNVLGTNPQSIDTDSDGLNDNVDPAPGILPTPTITPFPTIPGTAGDTCPGSPPSRLEIGMAGASVEPGGEANRLRAEPSLQGEQIGRMEPGSIFNVVGGPACDPEQQIRYWEVNFNGIIGWTAEGEGEEYYLAPPEGEGGGEGTTPPIGFDTNYVPPAPVGGDSFAYGGQVTNPNNPATLAAMQRAGMTWMKVQVRYTPGMSPDVVAPTIATARANNMRLLLTVTGHSNDIAGGSEYLNGYVAFVAGVAELGPDAIEIWNEPNIDREWLTGRINGAMYTTMLAASYTAITQANPDVLVISAAPAPTGAQEAFPDRVVNDDTWMTQFVSSGGLDYAHCVGAHYNEGTTPPNATTGDARGDHYTRYFPLMVGRYRQIIGSRVPLCFTELGYLSPQGLPPISADFGWSATITVDQQADWLSQAIGLASQPRANIPLVIVWNVDFTAIQDVDPMAGFAIIRPDGACPTCDRLGASRGG